MRFMLCKIHCPPFICFCKPSSHIYTTSGPLKLENSQPHPNSNVPCSKPADTSDQLLDDDPIEIIKEDDISSAEINSSLKGNLRMPNSSGGDDAAAAPKDELKKRVQWLDFVGKELVEIREFECSDLDDTDNEDESRRGCICVIL